VSAAALIWRALDLGVSLSVRGDKVAWRARPGVMTPELLAEIRQHKADIISLLTTEAWADDPAEFHNWSQEPDPEPIDWAERPDVRMVVEDLFRDDRWHPHRIARVLGLTRGEVPRILQLRD
jgi:hypothetical protein